MKKVFLFLSLCLLVVSFTNDAAAQQQKLRIGVAGIQIENSVFMPNRQPIVGRPLTLPDYLSPDSAMGQAATWLSLPDGPWRWPRTGYERIIRRLCQRST